MKEYTTKLFVPLKMNDSATKVHFYHLKLQNPLQK